MEEKGPFTASGIPLKAVYAAQDIAGLEPGLPGQPPYVRGAYPRMYQERPWRIKQIYGCGTVEESRQRGLWLREQGQETVNFFVSGPFYTLYDPDDPEMAPYREDMGILSGAASLQDLDSLLEGVDLGKTYVSCFATPQTSPLSYACLFSLAEKRGVPLSQLSGTGMNDLLLAYLCCPAKDQVPPRAALRLVADTIEYCAQNAPRFMAHCFSGNDIRETGCNAYQELALILANAISLIDELLGRGKLPLDSFAYQLATVSLNGDRDFFEEVAKFRAARRLWCWLLKERYGAREERSWRLRIHVETAGSSLTYQQPLNNIVRVAYQVLAAALGGVQSISADSYDEPFAFPSQESALLALRTHHIAQAETNITAVADPLGGSYYVEWLTGELERRARDYLAEIEARGGFLAAMESGWLHQELMKAMWDEEQKVERGEKKVVGVNHFPSQGEAPPLPLFEPNPRLWEIARDRLERLRRERDGQKLAQALEELRQAARGQENIMPAMIRAAQANATPGDIGKAFREVFSTWKPPFPI